MLTREQKSQEVADLRERIGRAKSLVLVDYRGLTVSEASALRGKLRKAGDGTIEYRVAKNTLLKRASAGTAAEAIHAYLSGPTAIALSFDEPTGLAKTLVDYAKDNEKFGIKGGWVEGELVDPAMIRRLADMPSKDEARALLAGALQAPVRKLAGSLHAVLRNLASVLDQRRERLEEA